MSDTLTQDLSLNASQAVEYFGSGYNCAQSVVCAFCDQFELPHNEARKIASGLGGGIGGLRQTCGALTGAVLLMGLKHGDYDLHDNNAKRRYYALIKGLESEFAEKFGSSNCRELLINAKAHFTNSPLSRDDNYYKSRPCAAFVAYACELFKST